MDHYNRITSNLVNIIFSCHTDKQLTFSPLTPTFTPSLSPDVMDPFSAKFFLGGYWN